jgi:tetratricopeptide (TPR) repeat protein
MNTERRTELQSNLLADRLERLVLSVKPYLKYMAFALIAAIAIAIIYATAAWQREQASASAWTDFYFSANRPEKLRDVFQDHPSQTGGLWARQKSADNLMAQALQQIYIDRDTSDKLLAEAREQYQLVLAKASEPLLVCRASYGLAKVLDSEGKAEEALREYKKVLTLKQVHPELLQDVQRRIEFIQSKDGENFFAWFKTNRPTAPKPVDIPEDLKNLPDKPDLDFAQPATGGEAASNPPLPGVVDPVVSSPASPPSSQATPPALTLPPAETPAAAGVVNTPPSKPPALEVPLPEPSNSPGATRSPADSK